MRALQQPHHPHKHRCHKLRNKALRQAYMGWSLLKPGVCRMDLRCALLGNGEDDRDKRKEKKAQELLGINGKWASFDDFWDNYNNYKLDAPLKKAYKDGDTKLQKQLRDADEKFNIIRMLYGGEMLKMFPYAGKQGHMQWFAPGLTMLIYSAPLHADIKWLRKAQHMHIYMLLAFLSVLMTYFGVNYFLSGMHSYA